VLDAGHSVVVCFGGDDSGQAALELGGRIAAETGAPLRVVAPAEAETAATGAGLVVVGVGAPAPPGVPTLFVQRSGAG
jgi:hypothetical protein